MKKGINKQTFLCIVIFALLIVVAAYFLGYKKFAGEAETKTASNVVLQTTVDELKVYHINKATYEAEMPPMLEEVAKIMDKYPADTRPEDVIMHAVNTQLGTEVTYNNINIGDKEVFTTVPVEVVQATNQENMQEAISFVKVLGTYTNEVTYENLKGVIQAVFDSDYNMAIDSISYARAGDDDPVLTGSVDLMFYSMVGNGKTYELPNIMPYDSGSSNIFGFLTVDLEDAIADALGMDEEENGVGATN